MTTNRAIRCADAGVLLRDARVNASRSLEDVAGYLHIAAVEIEGWEWGESSPSLPQLELLAYFFDVPVSHFWGLKTLESERAKPVSAQEGSSSARMIGALLRQSREEIKWSVEDLAARTAISVQELHDYEVGEAPIPMHELAVLANAVNKTMGYFLETASQIGDLLSMREKWKHFNTLPEELREFAANPQNIGFIEIALNFSQMNSEYCGASPSVCWILPATNVERTLDAPLTPRWTLQLRHPHLSSPDNRGDCAGRHAARQTVGYA